ITLASPVPGVLDFVTPKEGDIVQAEQEIAGLQDDVVEAQRNVAKKEAENDVEKRYAVKAAEVAEAELRKSVEANRRLRNSVAAVEIERLQLAAERARLQIEQAENQMEINQLRYNEAEANLKTHHIRAPFRGTITRKFKSRGEAVRQGDPILQIVSTDEVKVEGYVTVLDSLRLKAGDKVEVQLTLEGFVQKEPFEGVLTLVEPKVDPIRGEIRVAARVQNPDNVLKAGLTATMKIIPQKGEAVQTTQLSR
ncbi:MAG: efflux RND transporter periplasmic adaptor subunit, partial [Planctomycetaceae bacterium]|nr:efflux RND transporter periplasmic adaptor subunit [Planctomycetaceae bacterium]